MVVSMGIFAIMLGLVVYGHGHSIEVEHGAGADSAPAGSGISLWARVARAGQNGLGANLDAPADPARPYPARPEWYFLFLFQLLKYFPGESEVIGTVAIPGLAFLFLFALPLFGMGRMRRFGHVAGIVVISGLLLGIAGLTYRAIADDNANTPEAQLIRDQMAEAEELAKRAIQLASRGVPEDGAMYLLRRDPQTQGKVLFGTHCAGCHNHKPQFDSGDRAADLTGFGTERWIRELLRDPSSPAYFGHTELNKMTKWLNDTRSKLGGDTEKLAQFERDLDLIAAWLARNPRGIPEEDAESEMAVGFRAFEKHCSQCHTYEGEGGGDLEAPDFTGYGSIDWIRLMVMAPDSMWRYGVKNTMPAFRNLDGPGSEVTKREFEERGSKTPLQHLSDVDRELILRWLTGDQHIVFGGTPIATTPK
jgi:ubiquinol-cytochrome c reductase cytochrome b subunit